MKHFIIITSILLFLYGCGNSTTGNKTAQQGADSLTITIVDTNYIPKNLISSPVIRAIDKEYSPIEIDLRNPNSNYDKLDIASHFKRASIKVLEYPVDSGSFVQDKQTFITIDRGAQIFYDFTRMQRINESYLVCDNTNGILLYDSLGNYVTQIHKNKLSGLKYNKRNKSYEIPSDRWNTFSVLKPYKGHIAYLVIDSLQKINLCFWNLEQKKIVAEKTIKQEHPIMLASINDTLRYRYRTTTFDTQENPVMLYFFNEKGDTLSKYTDYIKLNKRLNKNYTGAADALIRYTFNGNGYIRQPYSDTIFKILSPTELRPAYLLQMGDKKPSMDIGYYGDKSNYFMLQGWNETKDMILITYSKNYDCPKNREEKSVSFYYAVYSKNNGKISYLDMGGAYPQQAWITNSLPMSLPISIAQFAVTSDGKIHIRYFKNDLENMINSPNFVKFPTQQQELITQLANELSPRKIAVMTLE